MEQTHHTNQNQFAINPKNFSRDIVNRFFSRLFAGHIYHYTAETKDDEDDDDNDDEEDSDVYGSGTLAPIHWHDVDNIVDSYDVSSYLSCRK